MKNSVAVISGGMDSVTMLHQYHETIKLAINFDYGSKHNKKERVFAQQAAEKFGIQFVSVQLPFINELFSSALLSSSEDEVPEGHYEDETMKATVVPFRNGIMLSIAAGIADSNDATNVFIANHFGDHAIYPDCRASFIAPMSTAIREGTYGNVQIRSPYVDLDKREVGLIGRKLGVDFSKTWTCYKGQEKHCGKCGACVERREALEGFDITEYE